MNSKLSISYKMGRLIVRSLFVLLVIINIVFSGVAQAKVEAFFNQYELASYKDPYRKIERRGHNLEAEIIKIINKAQKSVYIAVQELRLPKIAQALVEKQQAGVDVRLILEHDYNNSILVRNSLGFREDNGYEGVRYQDLFAFIDLNHDGKISKKELLQRDAIYYLKKSKVKIKDDDSDKYGSSSGLMHHKFVVVDDKHLVLSSANFTMSGIHGDVLASSSTGNSNAIITLSSEELGKIFTEEFLYMWGGISGRARIRYKTNKPYRGRQEVDVNKTKVTVQFSPTSRQEGYPSSVNGLITDTISKAKKSINMALFVFSDQKIADAIQKRWNRIKEMELGLLIESRFAYRNYSEMLDFWGVELLNESCKYEMGNNVFKTPVKNAGVPRLNGGDMLHHKFAVIDNSKVIFGSQNWSNAANNTNDEFLVVIEDADVAEQFTNEFKRLNRNARLGAPKSLLEKIQAMEDLCF